ncbi:MAG: transposase [Pseudanabaena sp.]
MGKLIESAGCKSVYLPDYSPDLKLIEKYLAWLKSRTRKLLHISDNLRNEMKPVLSDSAS